MSTPNPETGPAAAGGIQIGRQVPDFRLTTYLPARRDFGEFTLADQKKAGRWTILFFYPADFTFV